MQPAHQRCSLVISLFRLDYLINNWTRNMRMSSCYNWLLLKKSKNSKHASLKWKSFIWMTDSWKSHPKRVLLSYQEVQFELFVFASMFASQELFGHMLWTFWALWTFQCLNCCSFGRSGKFSVDGTNPVGVDGTNLREVSQLFVTSQGRPWTWSEEMLWFQPKH